MQKVGKEEMNKKVDEKFIGIKNIYQLQCLCTELNDEVKRLKEELLKYAIQNTTLQQELVRLKVNNGERVY